MRKFLFVVMAVVVTGCAVRPPQVVKETVVVPQIVKETVVVEKEVTRIVEVPAPASQAQPEPAIVSPVAVSISAQTELDKIRAMGIEVVSDWPTTQVGIAQRLSPQGSLLRADWFSRPYLEESYGWKFAPTEKDFYANIVGVMVCNPFPFSQDGWMANVSDRERFGRTEEEFLPHVLPKTAIGSGIPANWCGLVEGATFRPYDIDAYHRLSGDLELVSSSSQALTVTGIPTPTSMPVLPTAITPTPVVQATVAPATPVPTAVPVTEWGLERVRELYKLDGSVTLELCGPCCVKAPPQAAFQVTNPFNQWVDGYRVNPGVVRPGYTDPKVGIPPQSTEMVEAATFWCQ